MYFDRKYGTDTQQLLLTSTDNRQIPYLEDILKTTKAPNDYGWVGAKLEYNAKGGRSIKIPGQLYGYKVVGVSQISGFWKDIKGLNSQKLLMSDLKVMRDVSQDIDIEVLSRSYELYQVILDLSVNKFDIDNGVFVNFSHTQIYRTLVHNSDSIKFDSGGEIGSLPKFIWLNGSATYAWVNNQQKQVEMHAIGKQITVDSFGITTGSSIDFPVAEQGLAPEVNLPVITYF